MTDADQETLAKRADGKMQAGKARAEKATIRILRPDDQRAVVVRHPAMHRRRVMVR